MSRWARKLAWLLARLGERLFAYIREAAKIHGDDTPVTFLSNGDGSRTGPFWVYLRDDRSSGDMSRLPLPSASAQIVAERIRQNISPAIRGISRRTVLRAITRFTVTPRPKRPGTSSK
jgi:hypothetical protein